MHNETLGQLCPTFLTLLTEMHNLPENVRVRLVRPLGLNKFVRNWQGTRTDQLTEGARSRAVGVPWGHEDVSIMG